MDTRPSTREPYRGNDAGVAGLTLLVFLTIIISAAAIGLSVGDRDEKKSRMPIKVQTQQKTDPTPPPADVPVEPGTNIAP